MLIIVSSPTATTAASSAASSASSASSLASIAVASTTAPAVGIVMIPITIFYFSIIGIVWILSSHLRNDLLLIAGLPATANGTCEVDLLDP
jgi:hypothetical protein